MSYITTPLGQRLADPLTIQAFETAVVNSNLQLLETQGTANASSLATLAAQAFNSKIRGRASRGTASIASATTRTPITMATLDTAFSRTDVGSWSIVSGGLAVPKQGEYLARFSHQISNGTGERIIEQYTNGASGARGILDSRTGTPNVSTYVTIFEVLQLNAAQYVTQAVAQNSGGALTYTNPDVTLWYLGAI